MVDCSAYCWWPVRSDGYVCGRAHIACYKMDPLRRNYCNYVLLKLGIYSSAIYTIYSWWFQYVLLFIPTWGNDPIWRAYFSNGLVQPTTRYTLPKTNIAAENGGFQQEVPFPGVYVQVRTVSFGEGRYSLPEIVSPPHLHTPNRNQHQPTISKAKWKRSKGACLGGTWVL